MATPKKSSHKAKKAKPNQAATANNTPRTKVTHTQQPSGGSFRKTLAIFFAAVTGTLLLAYFVFGLNPFEAESDNAQQNEEKTTTIGTQQSTAADKATSEELAKTSEVEESSATVRTETDASETDTDYVYTAGVGESLTSLARQAIARSDSSLTNAERIAAETRLVQATDGELLELGQKVEYSKGDVNAAVEWAKALSDEAKASWQPYADLVAW